MVVIRKEHIQEMIEHAKTDLPIEACGILGGKNGVVEKVYRMKNMDNSSTTFFMDPEEQLLLMKKMRESDLEMVAIYHSHPFTRAYPSQKDIELAFYPESSYIIISIEDRNNPVIRSFRILDGKVYKEDIKVEDENMIENIEG